MKELRNRTGNEWPGRPCPCEALSGRRAARVVLRRRPGGPERADAQGSGKTLSVGRAATSDLGQHGTFGGDSSAARVIVAAAVACLLGISASAQTFVHPGQTGVSSTVEIENASDSGADIASAQVAVSNPGAVVTNI